jgi:hypothetical protein
MHSNAWFEELRALFWQRRKMCLGKFLQDSCLNSSTFLEFSKNCLNFWKLTRKHQIPRTLSEACRAWEDQVDKWKAFLDAHPEIRTAREEDIDDPQPWTWEEWKRANKFTDSSRRVAVVRGEPDPWAGVPEVSFHYPSRFLTNPW